MCFAAGSRVQLCTFRSTMHSFRYIPASVAAAFTIYGRHILLAQS